MNIIIILTYVILIIVYILICMLIASRFGAKRNIGYCWSLYFCITLGILPGVIFTLNSKKLNGETRISFQRTMFSDLYASLVTTFSFLSIATGVFMYVIFLREVNIPMVIFSKGIIGIGVYLLEII